MHHDGHTPAPDGISLDDAIRRRFTLLTAEGFTEDDAEAWAAFPAICSPEDLVDLALWWREGGFATDEAIAWIQVLGAHGMLWAPGWAAAGYTPDQAADLLSAGIGVDEAIRHWPVANHDHNLPRLRLLAALRTESQYPE